jgi:hypothetical protein
MSKAKLIKKSEQHKTEAPMANESPRRSLQTTAKSVMQWVRENRESDARSPREKFAALFAQTQA